VLTLTPRSVRIRVRVQPRSARDRVIGAHAGVLKLHVTAPPVGGAANRAATDLVAAWLSVPRAAVRVARGASGRDKLLEVSSDDPADLMRRIETALSALR
jgi:uncharacterized protein YggU (UPF0235/DUF167 family)